MRISDWSSDVCSSDLLVAWLEPLGVSVAWLTGNQKTRARRQITEEIASGQAQLIVGTQALIQDKIIFANLGLIILDEQHRFGVDQRLRLSRKDRKSTRLNSSH